MKTQLFVLSLAAIVLLTFSPLFAQNTGSITGSVKDPSQGVLQGARVEVHPSGQVVISDSQGSFQIFSVAPGHYTVTVSYLGSERYPIQREYYNRTVSAGMRWTLPHEK